MRNITDARDNNNVEYSQSFRSKLMNNSSFDRLLPFFLAAGSVGIALVPVIDSTPKVIISCTGIICSTIIYVINRKSPLSSSATKFKVSIKEISFVHYERPKSERPQTNEITTKWYEEAKLEQLNRNYKLAADKYSKAFESGGEYWAAKVNEGYCYQADGDLEKALATYGYIEENCNAPRFRRQALGNSGEIYRAMAQSSNNISTRKMLALRSYEKYAAAKATEETFVSLYNLWQAASMVNKTQEASILLIKLQSSPEFEQLKEDQKIPAQSLVA